MNEAALYALEHIDTTVEIHDAIPDMEKLVFKGFDSAVKESISDWFGENWQCDQSYNLIDGEMYIYYIKDAPDWDKVYIALVYEGSRSDKKIYGHSWARIADLAVEPIIRSGWIRPMQFPRHRTVKYSRK